MQRAIGGMAAVISGSPRWARALAVLLLVAAWVLVAPRGGAPAMVAVVISAVAIVLLAYAVTDERDRPWVVPIALLAILARDALVGLIDVLLLSRGNLLYAPDERVYIGRAALIYQHWLDPAAHFDHSDPYVRSWHVHLMARLYQVVGGENIVVAKLFNTTLAVSGAVLVHRTMRNLGLGGARVAMVILLAFPSVAFWTALTLKDSHVIFFLIASLWATSEYVRSRRALWLVVAVGALVPIESVRTYMFAVGALALLFVPLALARWKERFAVGAGLLAAVYVLFAVFQPFKDLGPNALYIPIFVRGAAAQGARSAFVEPAPVVRGEPGEQLILSVTGATAPPGVTPRTVVIRPGTEIIVELGTPVPSQTPGSENRPTAAILRPGDIVLIAMPSGAPRPSRPPRMIGIDPGARNTVGLTGEDESQSFEQSLATNIKHLPTGILYTLFAPFPWTVQTLEQYATIPEMVLWYLCLAAALYATVVLLWRRDLSFAHGFAMTAGLIIVLSLIGANVGTLIRSRAMLIPYVLILAGLGFSLLLERYPQVTARWNAFVRARRSRTMAGGPT